VNKFIKLYNEHSVRDLTFYGLYHFTRFVLLRYIYTPKIKLVAKIMGLSLGEKSQVFGGIKNVGYPGSRIAIGDNTKIAPSCIIVDSDFHCLDVDHRADPGFERDNRVAIEENALIGMNCIILKGVIIGRYSMIGAGSVITKDVELNSICAGNPARLIRQHTQ
jgi:acetyltransferase-like isoleucine patch superfamily enzyme